MLLSGDEFRTAWYDPAFIEVMKRKPKDGITKPPIEWFHNELVTPSLPSMEGVLIPEPDRTFLLTAGLPEAFEPFAIRFSTLTEGVPLLYRARENTKRRGIPSASVHPVLQDR